jgi:multidrug transporter EmrE-like cation transporter
MESAITTTVDTPEIVLSSRSGMARSIMIVFFCTILGAGAQLLLKMGAGHTGTGHVTLVDVVHRPALIVQFALGVFSNVQLLAGYCLYGMVTFLMAVALKGKELSRLFPIIALTYVWVTVLSVMLLNEHMNFFRSIGIAFIVGGVSVLGLKK